MQTLGAKSAKKRQPVDFLGKKKTGYSLALWESLKFRKLLRRSLISSVISEKPSWKTRARWRCSFRRRFKKRMHKGFVQRCWWYRRYLEIQNVRICWNNIKEPFNCLVTFLRSQGFAKRLQNLRDTFEQNHQQLQVPANLPAAAVSTCSMNVPQRW